MTAYLNQYQQNQIETASPEQILLMLYDGAIRFTRQAITGLKNDDLDTMRYGISKAMAIIVEFSNTLDHNVGGQIAEDLDGLYGFMIREFTHCNIKPELKKLESIETILIDLRGTWGEAVEINKQEQQTNIVKGQQTQPKNVAQPTENKNNGGDNAGQKKPTSSPAQVATGTYGAAGTATYTKNSLPDSYSPLSVSK